MGYEESHFDEGKKPALGEMSVPESEGDGVRQADAVPTAPESPVLLPPNSLVPPAPVPPIPLSSDSAASVPPNSFIPPPSVPSAKRVRRGSLMPFLLVGMVGAIIGGLLVIGIAPQILMSRAGLTPLSSGGPLQSAAGTGDRAPTTPLTFTGDPWQSIVAVAERVSPAVVGIVNQQGGLYDFFGREYSRDTSGSGLIVTSDGYIVTNNHVVENQKSLTVYLADGRSLKARVVGTDPRTDLAVVKVDATGLPTGVFGDSDQLRAGELAVAIGNPLGMDFSRTVTAGVVSGLNRVIDISDEAAIRLIQTDAVINPGNSGGPLVNANSEVIGLTSMKLVTENVEGMGFAIPSNMVKRVATEIIQTGTVKRAQIGVNLVDAEAAAKQYSLRVDRGAYVAEVTGTPAQKAGLKAGDVIVALDGTAVNSTSTLRALLAERSPGDKVTLKVVRGTQDLTLEVVLGQATR